MNRPCDPLQIGRWDSDLVWPATINRGGGQLAFPPTHRPSPIDSMFSICSHNAIGESRRECIGTFKTETETKACLKRRLRKPLRRPVEAMCAQLCALR